MIDYSNVSAICFDCAMKAGLTPKYKAACMWVSECSICHKQKPCTDLWHDWNPPETESEVKNGER